MQDHTRTAQFPGVLSLVVVKKFFRRVINAAHITDIVALSQLDRVTRTNNLCGISQIKENQQGARNNLICMKGAIVDTNTSKNLFRTHHLTKESPS